MTAMRRPGKKSLLCAVAFFAACSSPRPPENDEEQVARLTKDFVKAIGARDFKAALSFWESQAPYFVPVREELRQLFVSERLTVSESAVRVEMNQPGQARAFCDISIEGRDTSTGDAGEGLGGRNRLFVWHKEGGIWKLWRYAPAEAEIADKLIAAHDAGERARILSAAGVFSHPDLIRVLREEAHEAAKNKPPDVALALASLAVDTAAALGDPASQAQALLSKADLLRQRFALDEAESLALDARERFRKIADQRGEAAALRVLGWIDLLRKKLKKAEGQLNASLALAQAVPDRSAEAGAEGALGELARLGGHPDRALELFQHSLELCLTLRDRACEAAERANIGNVWQARAESAKALELYMQAVALDEDLRDNRGQGIDWNNAGAMYDATSQYERASAAYEKAIAFDRLVSNREGEEDAINNVGLVLQETGRVRESLGKFAESLAVAEQLDDPAGRARAISNAGTSHQLLGEFDLARAAFEDSLYWEGVAQDPGGEAVSRATIGELDFLSGRFHDALEAFAGTIPVFRKQGMKLEWATSLHNMASVYQATDRPDLAAPLYQKSFDLKAGIPDKAGQAATLRGMAELYRLQGRYDISLAKARQGADLAHEIHNPALEAANLVALGESLRLAGRLQESRDRFESARHLAESTGAPDSLAAAWTGLGLLDLAQNRAPQAESDCQNAVSSVEAMRYSLGEPSLRMGFFGQNQQPYHCLLQTMLQLNRKEDALRAAEKSRARTLTEALGRAHVGAYRDLKAEDTQKLRELDERVAEAELALAQSPSDKRLRNLKDARASRDTVQSVLYRSHPALAIKRGDFEPAPLEALSALVPDERSALLEYVLGDDESWLFVVRGPARKGGRPELFIHRVPADRRTIDRLARGFRERLRTRNTKDTEERQLFTLLLAPAAHEIEGVTTLGIVPDGSLWLAPFAAIHEANGRYMIQNRALYYAPSFTALRAMTDVSDARRPAREARLRSSAQAFLLVGNPSFGPGKRVDLPRRGSFSELPETATEVQGIAAIPGIRGRILMGADATEANVKREAGNYPFLHFAVHGYFDAANPLYSGIVLSSLGNTAQDGVWEAREIAERQLETELVVVSGCDTAAGDIFSGEGVLGLSWAFFVAGAPSTLLTTWQVNDPATSVAMRRFYEEWGIGKPPGSRLDKARALQRMQMWMLDQKEYAAPYYWAPFVLIGAPR